LLLARTGTRHGASSVAGTPGRRGPGRAGLGHCRCASGRLRRGTAWRIVGASSGKSQSTSWCSSSVRKAPIRRSARSARSRSDRGGAAGLSVAGKQNMCSQARIGRGRIPGRTGVRPRSTGAIGSAEPKTADGRARRIAASCRPRRSWGAHKPLPSVSHTSSLPRMRATTSSVTSVVEW